MSKKTVKVVDEIVLTEQSPNKQQELITEPCTINEQELITEPCTINEQELITEPNTQQDSTLLTETNQHLHQKKVIKLTQKTATFEDGTIVRFYGILEHKKYKSMM